MVVRRSIFDSAAERKLFAALQSQWSDKFRLYPQLPLAKLFSTAPSDATAVEKSYFYKANVDYTLCDLDDRPVIAIEFDGIGGGFGRGGQYVHGDLSLDSHRQEKLEFKLRLAREAGFPLFIVSYKEIQPLERGEALTILDGIIARALYKKREEELIREYAERDAELVAAMDDMEADEYLQDLVLRAGIEAEFQTDIFGSDRIRWALMHLGIIERFRTIPYEHPPATSNVMDERGVWDWAALRRRADGLQKATAHGTKLVIKVKGGPTIVRDVRVRAVGDWFSAHDLSERIAVYLGIKHAAQLVPHEQRAEFERLTAGA